jgi:hypothetical protein
MNPHDTEMPPGPSKSDLARWENEGGALAPDGGAAAVQPESCAVSSPVAMFPSILPRRPAAWTSAQTRPKAAANDV